MTAGAKASAVVIFIGVKKNTPAIGGRRGISFGELRGVMERKMFINKSNQCAISDSYHFQAHKIFNILKLIYKKYMALFSRFAL
jgi:hypothetical protein